MLKRLPSIHDVLSVFAVITFMTYGWTLLSFLWKLPSWLYYLTPGEILIIYFHSILTNFVESMIILLLILFLCIILPARFISDIFIVRGTVISISVLFAIMYTLILYTYARTYLIDRIPAWVAIASYVLILLGLFPLLAEHVPSITSALSEFADRVLIFLYVNLPLTFLALVVLAVRNLG